MIFRTPIISAPQSYQIEHKDTIFCVGSCFAENISKKLSEHCFEVVVNPLGVIYNPISIYDTIERVIENRQITVDDLKKDLNSNLYYSFDTHTLFNSESCQQTAYSINKKIEEANSHFIKSNVVIITLGTSFIYRLKESQKVVANCQKQPASLFDREFLSLSETTLVLKKLLSKVEFKNKHIILTVSPIRHTKDGHESNSFSKASLLCSVHEICNTFKNVSYFPSYEIMIDDLRDYRFYAQDMIHPTETAIEYIWQHFLTRYVSENSQKLLPEIKSIQKRLSHRPFNPESESHQKFLDELKIRIENLNKKCGKNIF